MLVGGEGGRDRTEVVHNGQTSHRTEENMPVGAGEFPVGGLSDLQCQGYCYFTEYSYLLVLSLLPVQGNSCDFLHLLFKSANSHEVPALWQAPWSVWKKREQDGLDPDLLRLRF